MQIADCRLPVDRATGRPCRSLRSIALYDSFNIPDSATDPIQIVRRFERADDREVVAFCAAALAFGRVASVLQSIERLLAVMGRRPAAYVRRVRSGARRAHSFARLVHRWIRGRRPRRAAVAAASR